METLVLYPSPGMGHLISMVELGKFIIHHHPSFAITILIAPPSFNTGSTDAYIRHISATVPSIIFHHLPAISLDLDAFPSMEAVIFEVLHRSNPDVRRALETIALSATVSAFIIDFFCTTSLPIATELHIPTYYFITSGACCLALFFYFPFIHKTTTKSFKDMNTLLHVPGIPPLPSSDMIRPMLDRTSTDYENFLNFAINLSNAAGIIVNTFESLETKPLKAMREGKCNPDGHTPPVFCVGPLLATEDRHGGAHDCLHWLDKQPSKSVVYICFGSLGSLSLAQVKEIAKGLERSGHRFLWVLRSPPVEDRSKRFLRPPEPDLDSLLPTGFLDATKDQGLVVKSWAPQVAVLNHKSVGGFVTHSGWNSILESVCAGVPMVAWPLYAEQHLNRVVVVEDMKMALRMEEAEEGLVAAEEVEKRVRELMDTESEKGKEIRKVIEEKSVEAKAAMREGGSSVAALGKLAELWKSDNGLYVPVIRDTDKKGLSKISDEVKHLAQKAKENTLKPEDYEGGTFTVTNLGGPFGIKQFCAIINPPQSGILAVGSAEKRVIPGAGPDQYKFASFMSVTLSCDHRVIDGAIGAEWLKAFKGYIENPESMLL